ncbi:MAG: PH domain-containing protein [Pseudomonadota bacterium]
MTLNAPSLADDRFWSPYLEPNERLLWADRPPFPFHLTIENLLAGGFVFAFMSVWVFLVLGWIAATVYETGKLPIVGYLFGAIALAVILAGVLAPLQQWRTRYAVTDRRVLIRRGALATEIMTIPISSEAPLTLRDGRRGSVIFDYPRVGRGVKAAGFIGIRHPRDVHDMIRRVQGNT